MRRWSFRAVLATWTLALVAATFATALGVGYLHVARGAEEEALARAGRAADRALLALGRGLEPVLFEEPDGVRLVRRDRAAIDAAFGDARVALWRTALEGGEARGFLPSVGAIVVRALPGALPGSPPGAPPPGVLEASFPAATVEAQVRRFATRAALLTALMAAAAVLLSLLVARRLAEPLAALEAASEALGRGELDSPLALDEGGEAGELARTLESMRRRLASTTHELERRGAELEAVLAGVSDGVFAVDRDRRVRYLSPRAAVLLGVTPEEAIGRFCGDLLQPAPVGGERPCESSCPIVQARFRGPVRAIERIRGKDGELVARLASSPPSGGLQVQIVRDESAGEAARRARDAVVADLAHELKTPLAAQLASLELLRDRLGDRDPEGAQLVSSFEAGARRLSNLIDNLLESVRIESGELGIRRLEVDLDEVVEEAVATTAPLAAKRSQRIEVDLPYPLARSVGDPPRLVQLLVNLLANASKFAPAASEIRIGGASSNGRVTLWIEDAGPGFELPASARFRRGGQGGEPREEGTGLGLFISRSIAERHGGALEVARVGDRTRVSLTLPATESAA